MRSAQEMHDLGPSAALTIPGLLTRQTVAAGDVALLAPDRPPIRFDDLRQQVRSLAAELRARGIGRGARIAVVLPNGPETITTFLAVAHVCAAAPLNPLYRSAELEFYLGDLEPAALILARGASAAARDAAAQLGIPVLELDLEDGRAGKMRLTGLGPQASGATLAEDEVAPGDEALVLHTSGTTSRPKMVPLTQANLCRSAANTAACLRLTNADRCLSVMPLFHIHGLVAGVLASLQAGASVFCAPGFDAMRFFGWLATSGATWTTAVPTMYRAILSRADRNRDIIASAPLRFLRTASAPMPKQLLHAIERVFEAPVIEAYGMTEAAHQISSNPLPPGRRKPGTVGLQAGPAVTILGPEGAQLAAGTLGEVGIRGDTVMTGYVNNPAANDTAFTDGWFRTGDRGFIDAEGYLTLTGRLKELINRGGEKVSPGEIEEVLLDHPAVREAVAFALPHPALGEEVGAAVVLEHGVTVSERQLREFAGARLAPFKVPRTIVITASIPTGPTGKIQRIGLATRLGLTIS